MKIALVIIALAALAFVGYKVYLYFKNRHNAATKTGKFSAFAKIADAEAKQKAAEGKLIAIKATATLHQAGADVLKASALEAHAAVDRVHEGLDEVHAILG